MPLFIVVIHACAELATVQYTKAAHTRHRYLDRSIEAMRPLGLAAFENKARFERFGRHAGISSKADLSEDHLQVLNAFVQQNAARLHSDKEFCEQFANICSVLGRGVDWFSLISQHCPAGPDQCSLFTGVLAIEECRRAEGETGGIIDLQQLTSALGTTSSKVVEQTIKELSVLGSGMDLETLPNSRRVVRSRPLELSSEHSEVLVACDALGYATVEILRDNLGWTRERAIWALDSMVSTGLLWIDTQTAPTQYWSPSAIF